MSTLRAEIAPGRPFLVFLILLVWIVLSASLLPRLFDGTVDVFSLSRASDNDGGQTPLHPTSGNISQTIYAAGGFGCAWLTCAYVRRLEPDGVTSAIILTTVLHIFFAVVDLVTAATGTGLLLDPIHNGG